MFRHRFKLVMGAIIALVVAAPAQAAFPGANGLIVGTIFGGLPLYQVTIVDPDTGAARPLSLEFPGHGYDAHWSPDGTKVVWTASNSHTDVVVTDAQGQTYVHEECPNAGDRPYPSGGSWMPNGHQIVFRCQLPPGWFLADVGESGSASLLPFGETLDRAQLAFSPDGTKVASLVHGNITLIDPDGSDEATLVDMPGPIYEFDWAPDSRRLVFAVDVAPPAECCGSGNLEVFVVEVASRSVTRLTNAPGPDSSPAFSPDGTRIVFVREVEPGITELFLMNATGIGQERLTFTPQDPVVGPFSFGAPDWQPIQQLPNSKADCKHGGWRHYGNHFKNEGKCVAFVSRRRKHN